ncbi:hypothetical protein J7643_06055 [bacterium]|nr:hypothetical protein [bacterium]
MRRLAINTRHLFALLVAGSLLAGCGAPPTSSAKRPTAASTAKQYQSTVPPANASASTGAEDDLAKNPFVLWVKRTYPQTAAQIIDEYLSQRTMANADPNLEAERAKMRRQVIAMVTSEFAKNVTPNLPEGLRLQAQPQTGQIVVSGTVQQMGQDIAISFEFQVRMDGEGIVWVTQPASTVKANSSSFLVKLLGGNLPKKASEQIISTLDKESPKSVASFKGVMYGVGGIFRIDPGLAFMGMP